MSTQAINYLTVDEDIILRAQEKFPVLGNVAESWADLMDFYDEEMAKKAATETTVTKKRKSKKSKKYDSWETVSKPKKSPTPTKSDPKPIKVYDNSTTIVVKNLPYEDVAIIDLMKMFEKHGKISNVNILRNSNGTCKGIAFVKFETSRGLNKAMKNQNGLVLHNRPVFITLSK